MKRREFLQHLGLSAAAAAALAPVASCSSFGSEDPPETEPPGYKPDPENLSLYPQPDEGSRLDPWIISFSDKGDWNYQEATLLARADHFAAACMQGMANRRQGQMLLIWDEQDQTWLDRLTAHGYSIDTSRERPLDWLKQAFESGGEFSDMEAKLLLYDPAIFEVGDDEGHSRIMTDVYTVMAGQEDLIPVPVGEQEEWDLPVAYDATKDSSRSSALWTEAHNPKQAFQWAIDQYEAFREPGPVVHSHPTVLPTRDYVVAHRLPMLFYWPDMGDLRSRFSQVLMDTGPNQPVIGIWDVFDRKPDQAQMDNQSEYSEHQYLRYFSGHGRPLLVTGPKLAGIGSGGPADGEGLANLTWHSGLEQKTKSFGGSTSSQVEYQPDKHYIALMVSDGDNVGYVKGMLASERWFGNSSRGEHPVNWSFSPAMTELMPGIMSYFYEEASENDYMISSLNGPAYMLLDRYARLYEPATREKIIRKYGKMWAAYMQEAGQKASWGIMDYDYDASGPIREGHGLKELQWTTASMQEHEAEVEALLLDYHKRPELSDPSDFNFMMNDIPTFHAATRGGMEVKETAQQIRQGTPDQGQGFMHVFLVNWQWNPPKINELVEALGEDYVPVSARTLGKFYKQAKGG